MNLQKHMEGIFVVALGLVWGGAVVIDLMPKAAATQPAAMARNVATPGSPAVVVVRAGQVARCA